MRTLRICAITLGLAVLAGAGLFAIWDWNWFRPLAAARASAALGREVTLRHFDLLVGWKLTAIGEGVEVANPAGSTDPAPFATITRVNVIIDPGATLRAGHLVMTRIEIEHPDVTLRESEDKQGTWLHRLLAAATDAQADPATQASPVGQIRVADGHVHVLTRDPPGDLALTMASSGPQGDKPAEITIEGEGNYGDLPMRLHLVGGSLLTLQDTLSPYPVALQVQNGPTSLSLTGTIQNPMAFAGARLLFDVAGPDMELLLPLIGLPTPRTPSYHLTGRLDVQDHKILLRDIGGLVGSTDLAGEIDIDPRTARSVVTGTLTSRGVDLADLGGFIGAEPGRLATPNQSDGQRADMARAESRPKLLPTVQMSQPTLRRADIHLSYHGAKILGDATPFDSMAAELAIEDGHVTLTPLTLGIGAGQLVANVDMVPQEALFRTVADISIERVDVGRVLAGAHLVSGKGTLQGKAHFTSLGDSLASVLAAGDGTLQVSMGAGGAVSALMLDLSGFRFGNAIFSALGIPNREAIRCFIGDFAMEQGVLNTRVFLLDTTGSVVIGTGTINLGTEMLDLRLKTSSKHFSIGVLPGWIGVVGPFRGPSVRPDIASMGTRAGIAGGLGLLFPPAALLPTIQLGVGEQDRCATVAQQP